MRMTVGIGRFGLGALAALLAWSGAGGAGAATLGVLSYTLGEQVQVASGPTTGSLNTAELQVELDGQAGFSYCVDLAQSIGVGASTGWNVLSPESNAAIVRAAWLVDRFHADLDALASKNSAMTALQLAVWETLYDGGAGTDLDSGTFALAQGGASAGALLLANGFLAELAGADLSAFATNARWAVSSSRQDQIVFTNPIPEPSSVVLFGFGAALVAAAINRSRTLGARRAGRPVSNS